MKLVTFFCIIVFSLAGYANEVLHAQSAMEKISSVRASSLAKNCFDNASDIELSVYREDIEVGLSSVDLSWNTVNPSTREIVTHEKHLVVYDHYYNKDNIGTVVARLPKVTDPNDPAFGVRFSIVLTDYTKFLAPAGTEVAYKWQAKVRSGNGWCSSSDARMTIRGNPTVYDQL